MSSVRRRPTVSREIVTLHQRRRFAVAAAEIAHEFGPRQITVTNLCRVAHGARNTFYDLFDNINGCLRLGVVEADERLFAPLREADGEGEWLLEVEAAIAGFYANVAAEPLLAEFLFVHSYFVELEPGDPSIETGIEAMTALLHRGRSAAASVGHEDPPPLAEEYLARVIVSTAALKVKQADTEALPALTREMTLLAGTTYMGAEAASQVLATATGAV